MALWAENVGAPVALDLAEPAPPDVSAVDVLCWNLAVGRARLDELLDRLQEGEFGGAGGADRPPLLILAQEAYRADDTIPHRPLTRYHGGDIAPAGARDIVELARDRRLSLRYAPSMRNGARPSDRGNAVLATAALGEATSYVLPFVRQRRVVVGAALAGLPQLLFLSGHLDTGGQLGGGAWGRLGGGRAAQAAALASRFADAPAAILGADLNSHFGAADPALAAFRLAGWTLPARAGAWRHTHHGPVRLALDHVLYRCTGPRSAAVTLHRLDETPRDTGRRIFGSDHHPLLARVVLRDR
jgi:hypothetical protein